MIRYAVALGLALAALTASCGGKDTLAPEQAPNQGQLKAGSIIYPAGPYGISEGSVIADYEFLGFATPDAPKDVLTGIRLGDFYNPHADDADYVPLDAAHDDRLYPPGSPYGEGKPKPRVLLVNVGSVWCPPCNEEAKTDLPPLHVKYSKCGGEFFLQLQDGATPGIAATPKNLISWTTKYTVNFPATIDPSGKLGSLFDQNAFPANMIIDTRTMKVVKSQNGVPPASFWKLYEATMNNAACLAGG